MSTRTSREVRLARRPVGTPTASDFELTEAAVPDPSDGEVLVRNVVMSVDPYMRARMIDRKSYAPPFEVGAVLLGGAVGEVIASRHERFQEGDHVLSMNGWREWYISNGEGMRKLPPTDVPPSAHLGVLGMPGLTAYVGLLDIGRPEPGRTVCVSGAAGAVGSVVCQIARLKGCRVVGSAGSIEKTAWLRDVAGVHETIDYKDVRSLRQAVADACPDGIDVYFDNVGGDHLEAALWALNDFGRIVACGTISGYNATEPPPGPRNVFLVVTRRIRWQGFIVSDHPDRFGDFARDMSAWIADGAIRWEETVYEGIEQATGAFIDLFGGANLGKMVVRLG
jgi:hypothetical protein